MNTRNETEKVTEARRLLAQSSQLLKALTKEMVEQKKNGETPHLTPKEKTKLRKLGKQMEAATRALEQKHSEQ
jgi:hypothetical protein